jgi:hypothetical protein
LIILRLLSFVLKPTVLLAAWQTVTSVAPAVPVGSHSLHVGLMIQRRDGSPVAGLTQVNFAASMGGQMLRFTVERPQFDDNGSQQPHLPTRLLIIFAPGVKSSGRMFPGILPQLRPIWRRSWEVALAQEGGRATGYATSPMQLVKMWNASAGPPMTAEGMIKSLKPFHGRRIVFYTTDSDTKAGLPPKELVQVATESMAQIFVLNGGIPGNSVISGFSAPGNVPIPAADTTIEGAQGTPNPMDFSSSRQPSARIGQFNDGPGLYHGLWKEVDVRRAVQNAVREALGYYDLQIEYPSTATISKDTTLSLKVNLKANAAPLITSKAYGDSDVPEVVLSTN